MRRKAAITARPCLPEPPVRMLRRVLASRGRSAHTEREMRRLLFDPVLETAADEVRARVRDTLKRTLE